MTSVIDLGEIGPETLQPQTPHPGRWRWSLRAVAALMMIVLGGGVAGAAPATWLPSVTRIQPLFEGPMPTVVIEDVLMDLDLSKGLLRAHEVDGSGVRWEVALEPGAWPEMRGIKGAVLVSMVDLPTEPTPFGTTDVQPVGTRAFDLRTGAELWRHDGSVVGPPRQGVVAVRGPGAHLAGLDTATGAERWRRTWTTPVRSVATPLGRADTEPDRVTVALSDGTVETLDVVTGVSRQTAKVRPGALEVYAWQDLLGVHYYGPDGRLVEFAVYRAGQAHPLWYRPLDGTSGGVWPCSATTFCRHTEFTPTEHVDPYTGSTTRAPLETADEVINMRNDVLGEVAGRDLLMLQPTGDRRAVWLGVGTRANARPLLPIGESLIFCSVQDAWLTCYDDKTPRSAYAVRVADLERLIDELA